MIGQELTRGRYDVISRTANEPALIVGSPRFVDNLFEEMASGYALPSVGRRVTWNGTVIEESPYMPDDVVAFLDANRNIVGIVKL